MFGGGQARELLSGWLAFVFLQKYPPLRIEAVEVDFAAALQAHYDFYPIRHRRAERKKKFPQC
ncbi:hypothetical protein [Paenibacillus macerans]|uniref:hypothetical protein n=1 Tax=Paenibacillus macerans TaxID=44252 RepID=UPI003D314C52